MHVKITLVPRRPMVSASPTQLVSPACGNVAEDKQSVVVVQFDDILESLLFGKTFKKWLM